MPKPPDGITADHTAPHVWDRHASPLSFVILAAIMVTALSGFTGGQPSPPLWSDFGSAKLGVKTPTIIRNGEFFETRITVVARAPITDAVIAVSPGLWHDMTVNTMIPAASEEAFEKGSFRFSYGPLAAGDVLEIKVDGQINPPLFAGNHGAIALYDGDRLVGNRAIDIKVLP